MKYYSILIFILIFTGCSTKNITPDISLYQGVGGQKGIERIVEAFVDQIARDKNILPYFAKSSVSHFKQGFIKHLCATVNGPCSYDGDSMSDIHTGMNITEKDFNRVVELLISAMEDAGIGYQYQNKILEKLAPLRKDIIRI